MAAGIISSFLLHITAKSGIILGLTALLVSMPHALDILRYCGIAYLLYLATSNLKIVKWNSGDATVDATKPAVFFLKGFIGNLLNPGALVFIFFGTSPVYSSGKRE